MEEVETVSRTGVGTAVNFHRFPALELAFCVWATLYSFQFLPMLPYFHGPVDSDVAIY
jgi:hypothetical protein